ncbi:hypothetical protein JCM16138_01140 [Thermococcus atlanticus]
MIAIKVKTLTREIISLTQELGLRAVPEYRTEDGGRIDLAILRGDEKLLAIELENSFKWIRQRVLYNAVKAHRAGFPELWVVYPFKMPRLGWVASFIEEELEMKLLILQPEEFVEKIGELTAR